MLKQILDFFNDDDGWGRSKSEQRELEARRKKALEEERNRPKTVDDYVVLRSTHEKMVNDLECENAYLRHQISEFEQD